MNLIRCNYCKKERDRNDGSYIWITLNMVTNCTGDTLFNLHFCNSECFMDWAAMMVTLRNKT